AFDQKHARLVARPAVAQLHELLHARVLEAGNPFGGHDGEGHHEIHETRERKESASSPRLSCVSCISWLSTEDSTTIPSPITPRSSWRFPRSPTVGWVSAACPC